jgi:hypothetical protein
VSNNKLLTDLVADSQASPEKDQTMLLGKGLNQLIFAQVGFRPILDVVIKD